jgi:hypothetical protein
MGTRFIGALRGRALWLALPAAVLLVGLPLSTSAWRGPGYQLDPFEQQVVDLVNAERRERGIPPLIVNYSLQEAAWMHTEWMAENKQLCHCCNGEPQRCVGDRIKKVGYKAVTAGENVASGQRTPQEVMEAWMGSTGHRNNILSRNYTDIGVAYARGGAYGTTWTQVFGKPAAGVPTITPPSGDPGDPGGVPTPVPEPSPRACDLSEDLDGDGEVTEADVDRVYEHLRLTPRDPGWDERVDLVADNVINVYDVFQVTLAVGKGCGQ